MTERLCPISTETDYRKHAEAHILAGGFDRGTYCHLASRHRYSRIGKRETRVTCFGPRPTPALSARHTRPDEVAIRSVDGGFWELVEVWE